ncbi:MAG TPA: hypothetical protein VI854_07040 [Acidimicrobiia bacterium]|nr:hypothetical protein [Acidimicrobiia bacterium]
MRSRLALALLLALTLTAAACGGDDDDAAGEDTEDVSGAEDGDLVGLFKVEAGVCDATGPITKGSSFRMIQPDGKPGDGPYVPNGDSPCGDKTFSPILPGDAGGLITGEFQPQVEPPFDEGGNGLASAMTKPTPFFAVTFANATNEKDPQTGKTTSTPKIVNEGGKLSGDLSAFAAAWNKQHFNQGAPKPGGDRPGLTSGPEGTYDEATGAYMLEWSSLIQGGPFNNFTGVWHLEGTFEAKG